MTAAVLRKNKLGFFLHVEMQQVWKCHVYLLAERMAEGETVAADCDQ